MIPGNLSGNHHSTCHGKATFGSNAGKSGARSLPITHEKARHGSTRSTGRERRSADRAAPLEEWLIELNAAHGHRIVEIDHRVAEQWGRMSAIRNVPTVDCLLAATAKVHRMTLVTRNEADVASLGVDVLNPFARKR